MSDTDTRTSAKPIRLTDQDEFEDLLASEERVLVEFFTNGCSKCAAMEPVLGNVARATDVTVGLVNAGHVLPVAEEYSIQSVPTLLLFEDGELVGRLSEGFVGAERVLAFVDGDLEDAPTPDDG